jgi:hypothetical protein
MGQYYKGKKIGTCESMYYMRMTEAEKLAKIGARDDDGIKFSEMLTDGVTRFRFPFPDEDAMERAGTLYMVENAFKGFTLPAGGVKVEHGTVTMSNNPAGILGGNINIFVPCPYSDAFKDSGLKSSPIGEQYIDVKFEGMRYANETKTGALVKKSIFSCSRCGELQRLPDEEVAKLKARGLEYFEVYNREGKNDRYEGDQEKYNTAIEVIKRLN